MRRRAAEQQEDNEELAEVMRKLPSLSLDLGRTTNNDDREHDIEAAGSDEEASLESLRDTDDDSDGE